MSPGGREGCIGNEWVKARLDEISQSRIPSIHWALFEKVTKSSIKFF